MEVKRKKTSISGLIHYCKFALTVKYLTSKYRQHFIDKKYIKGQIKLTKFLTANWRFTLWMFCVRASAAQAVQEHSNIDPYHSKH